MAKNISEIPFTELVERSRGLARTGNNTVEKIRGIVQDVAIREIPSKFDWNFLLVSSSLTGVGQYNQGSVSINTGDTTLVFSSDVVLDSTYEGYKIFLAANNQVYNVVNFINTTSLTISPSLQGATNIQSGGYTLFKDTFTLADNFDRFPKMGGIYYWNGQQKRTLKEVPYRQSNNDWSFYPSTNPDKCMLVSQDTMGNQQVQIIPPPSQAQNYGYDYFKQCKPMIEVSDGTISSITAKATQVTGNTNCRFLNAYSNGSDNLWFRVDALGVGNDSQWYKVLNILHDSSLTLSMAFANTAITSSANYVISSSPEMPARLHVGVLYGTVRSTELDQNDENFIFYHSQYYQVLSDSKRIYVSRPYAVDIEGIQTEYRYRY